MQRTTEENMQRKAIMTKGIQDAVGYLAEAGFSLPPEQAGEMIKRLGLSMARLHRDVPTEALGTLMVASTLQLAGELLGYLAPADPVAWVLELVVVGAEAGRAFQLAGGYGLATPEQRKTMVRVIRMRAQTLASKGPGMDVDPEAVRQAMRAYGEQVVRVVLGDPPQRGNLN